MKTTIVVEDGRVTISVDDGNAVEVKPGDVVIPIIGTVDAANGDVKPTPHQKPAKVVESKPQPTKTGAVKLPAPRSCEVCGGPIPQSAHALVKVCSDDCRKKKQREYAAKHYQKKNPGAKVRNPGQFAIKEDSGPPPLWQDAPESEPEFRSKCCNAKVRPEGDESVCLGCGRNCEIVELAFDDPWQCGACRTAGRLCRLHHAMDAEGKKPPLVRLT